MTILGIDDTDSRTEGMCTTYVGHRVVERLEQNGYTVRRATLTRLNPAAKYKTRGNASVSIHTDAPSNEALETAVDIVDELAASEDEMTNPGIVAYDGSEAPEELQDYFERAVKELLTIEEAEDIISSHETLESYSVDIGRGRIGALAAIGAWDYLESEDWTYELISYREPNSWGTPRRVDAESAFEASEKYYPDAWDTVDMVEGEVVAVPHTPCPILHGIRGDKESAVRGLAEEIDSEKVYSRQLFYTNQGTDMHLQESNIEQAENNSAYRIQGTVQSEPETHEGGHVFFSLEDNSGAVECAAFEPTKRFRDHVRNFRVGDRIEVCGEIKKGTLKIEKFKVINLNTTKLENPTCSGCGNSMSSAGADQGYRCRDCGTSVENKVEVDVSRNIETGWYEVPPCARRHIAKPLIRFDEKEETHPER